MFGVGFEGPFVDPDDEDEDDFDGELEGEDSGVSLGASPPPDGSGIDVVGLPPQPPSALAMNMQRREP